MNIIKQKVHLYQTPCEKVYEYKFGEHFMNVLLYGNCWKCDKAIAEKYPEYVNKGRIIIEDESVIPF